MTVVILDLMCAHPATPPGALAVLAAHTAPGHELRTRSVLTHPNAVPATADVALRALTASLGFAPAGPLVADGATISEALGDAPTLKPDQWFTLLHALPSVPAQFAAQALSAAVRSGGLTAIPQMLMADAALPLAVRCQALLTLSRMSPNVTASVLPSLAALATCAPEATRAVVLRSQNSVTSTLLKAAADPYPPNEDAFVLAGRVNDAVRARRATAYTLTLCSLLRSSSRATTVAQLLLAARTAHDGAVARAVADAVTVHPGVRAQAAVRALHLEEPDAATSASGLLPLLAAGSLEGRAVIDALLGARRGASLAAVMARTDLSDGDVRRLVAHPEDLEAPTYALATLLSVPHLLATTRAAVVSAVRSAATSRELAHLGPALTVAAGDPPAWQDLPLAALQGSAPTCTNRAAMLALGERLPGFGEEQMTALVALPDDMDCTIGDLFDLADTIAS